MQDSQTNTFLKGMNLDTAKEFIGSDQYVYAENIHLSAKNQTEGCITTHKSLYDTNVKYEITGKVLATTSGNIYCDNDGNVDGEHATVHECYIVLCRLNDNSFNLSAYIGVSSIKDTPTKVFDLTTSTLSVTSDRVKMINVYDNQEQSNVYIASKGSELQVVNLQVQNDPNDTFSIFPYTGALPPMQFYNEVAGSLDNCSVQYAYQLFDVRGKYTTLSAISSVIPVGSGEGGKSSGLGLQLKLNGDFQKYTKIRIYKLKYSSSSEIPDIYIKDEINVYNQNKIIYQDTGETYLAQLTLDEFQSIKRFGFSAATIEFFNNRLYAANIVENAFTIDFDARTYRCDKQGNVRLESDADANQLIECTIDDIKRGRKKIEYDHDAINPSLRDIGNDTYQYTDAFDESCYIGGSGLNIDYCFVKPYVYLSANNTVCKDGVIPVVSSDLTTNQNSFSIKYGDKFYAPCTFPVSVSGFDVQEYIDYDDIAYTSKSKAFNDTYFSQKFRGYKRGEIYPFGIIFYNQKHQPSQVHWIGDIKIPNEENPWIAAYQEDGLQHDCVGSSVGIRFKVDLSKIVDKDERNQISAFEIVRCDRTLVDRTILCQGAVSRLLPYATSSAAANLYKSGKGKLGFVPFCSNSLNGPVAISGTGNRESNYGRLSQQGNEPASHALSLISPEISANRDNSNQLLTGAKSIYIRKFMTSLIYSPVIEDKFGDHFTIFKNITQGVIYTKDSSTALEKAQGRPVATYTKINDRKTYALGLLYSGQYIGNEELLTDTLYKFFTPVATNTTSKKIEIDNFKYVSPCDVAQSLNDQLLQNEIIGSLKFFNVCGYNTISGVTGIAGSQPGQVFGAGGPKCILTQNRLYDDGERIPSNTIYMTFDVYEDSSDTLLLNNSHQYLNSFERFDRFSSWTELQKSIQALTAIVDVTCDIGDQYGGFSYSGRQGRSYTSIGCYTKVDADQNEYYVNCFGGDTFIELHNDVWSSYTTRTTNDGNQAVETKNYTVRIMYPVETSINISRAYGVTLSDPAYLHDRRVLHDPGQVDGYTQDKMLNAYYDAYSPHTTNVIHVEQDRYAYDSYSQPYRVIVSNVKNFGEVEDKLQDFDIINYINVDGKFGEVTNLVAHKDRLYYLQPRCFGMISSEERSLIQDNSGSSLLLGTGSVLQSHAQISSDYGNNFINDKSIICSDFGIYWFDSSTGDLVLYDGNRIGSLANSKNVESYFKNVSSEIHSGRNKQLKQIWFKAVNDTKTLVYSEDISQFVSYYTDNIEFISLFRTCSLGIDVTTNNFVKIADQGEGSIQHRSLITFVVNEAPLITKVFDTFVLVDTNMPTDSGTELSYNITCKTTRQTSTGGASYYKSIEGLYYFAIGRDANRERMRGRTLTVDFTTDVEFNIPSIQTIFRQSKA